MTLSPALSAPVTCLASAKRWIEALLDEKKSFHLEDDPTEFVPDLWTASDVPTVKARVAALYAQDWGVFECPIGYLLAVDDGHVPGGVPAPLWTAGAEIEGGPGLLWRVDWVDEADPRYAVLRLTNMFSEDPFVPAYRDYRDLTHGEWSNPTEEENNFPTLEEAKWAATTCARRALTDAALKET